MSARTVERGAVHITTSDGITLAASVFHPARSGSPAAVLILNSATGVRRQFYARFAAHLASRNIAVVTYDYRGIGDSLDKPIARYEASMLDWGRRDFAAVLQRTERHFASLPVFALGHSIGGQLLGLTPDSQRLAGVIGVAAQSGYWRLFPTRRRMWLTWHIVLPSLVSLFGYLPGWAGVGTHLPGGVAREWARWCRSRDFFVDESGTPLAIHFADIRAPVLWYNIQRDPYAPAAAVEWVARQFSAEVVERRELRGEHFGTADIGHFKLFTPRYRAAWDEIGDWVLAQASGAGRASPTP
jgi:predicted alpha/beta hydrolase